MEALIAKANDIKPLAKKRHARRNIPPKGGAKSGSSSNPSDSMLNSIAKRTTLPKSLRASSPLPENVPKYTHVANKRLREQLHRTSAHAARSAALLKDAEMLLMDEAGKMEVEGELERTWRVGQEDIVGSAGMEAAKGRRELKLDGGPYQCRYTRNGRFVFFLSFC